jgi:ribosome-binding factor A
MAYIEENKASIRKQIGQLVRHQMRVVPELHYHADDSLDYEATIDRLLREGGENPIL